LALFNDPKGSPFKTNKNEIKGGLCRIGRDEFLQELEATSAWLNFVGFNYGML
jgi:hypothetical protein